MNNKPESKTADKKGSTAEGSISAPAIALPKGGGAIRGIGEKFAANPVTGTGSMSVPIATSPGRGGFGPQLSLSYDSGAGNGPFGLGWSLSLPQISRKTDKGLPLYNDFDDSDVFILSGAEDLVPVMAVSGSVWPPPVPAEYQVYDRHYRIKRFRPRVEGLFALIEQWTDTTEPFKCFWRTISRDNVTTWYGRTADSRMADPDDPSRIFQWLICETHDDKGHVVIYDYLREDSRDIVTASAHELNRKPDQYTVGRYLHRIRYGNLKPYLPTLAADVPWPRPDQVPGQGWMFEVVFDYGQCDPDNPTPDDNLPWPCRKDPFSTYRAGFEIRTCRLCRRILMFHHFTNEPNVGANCLVRATKFAYREPTDLSDPATPGYTVLASVTHWSYERSSSVTIYESRQLPPVEFTYTEPTVDNTLHMLDPAELENLPVGTQGPGYQWVDLDGEGLSGVLTEQGDNWFYKPNLGSGRFGPLTQVAHRPAMAALASGRQQFMDLAGDGAIDLVDFSGAAPGFHERDNGSGWKNFVPFESLPNIDWNDPNMRFLDLTGDGLADVLITENDVFTWYPSQGEAGFDAALQTRKPLNEEDGPRIVFADGTQTIFLSDMSGDGLTDLARIRNGEVCYWPNLGYGRFGPRITLDNSPVFDHPDLYDPRRVRLADIDGSGPVDLIYLGRNGARLYFNRSGNSLSNPLIVPLPVATENLVAVQVADLLGNGTACLVWNSHLPADTRNPVRYIDLMSGKKPHLLIGVTNNLGNTTEIEYTPSTYFYIQDKLAGTPWITRLPFPVHCVSKVTVRDEWRNTTFSSTSSYHHGYFDGIEREFRGFGRVEQIDVERYDDFVDANASTPHVTLDKTLYQPPIKTVTWFHTGIALDRRRVLSAFASEYFPTRYEFQNSFYEKTLPEPDLADSDLTAEEWREALRACKGMALRQEIYELDVDDLKLGKQTPVKIFSAATHNCHIQRLQPRGGNKHAIFLVTESEAITYNYELALPVDGSPVSPDPRIAHTLNLRHDEFGNPQQSIAIGYGRWRAGDYSELPRPDLIAKVQGELHIAYSETRYTQDVLLPDPVANPNEAIRHLRLRLPCEVMTYELKGIPKVDTRYYGLADLRVCDLSEIYGHGPGETPPPNAVQLKQYHEVADGTARQKRIVEHARTLYFNDVDDTAPPDNDHALPFGQHGPRGLKYEDYKLALTNELLDAVFGTKLNDQVNSTLTAQQILDDPKLSGYIPGTAIDPKLTDQYWMRSGTAGFADDAHKHFFLPERYTDPFGNVTKLKYDDLDLFIRNSLDAKGNTVAIADDAAGKPRFDYRVLAPIEMVDANGNHSEVAVDILGLVVASAIKGKKIGTNQWEGDDLTNFDLALCNPSPDTVQVFCFDTVANRAQARQWLDRATTRFVYHFGDKNGKWEQRMAGACAIVRERHQPQVDVDTEPDIERKHPIQIALECSDGGGNVLMKKVQAEPETQGGPLRWIVNGLTVLNNKGKPVKQYEPAFSPDFGCELPGPNGVTPIMYYDAAGRLIRTEMPDGSFSRVEFSPWHVKTFDANDTILAPGNRWYAEKSAATALPEDQRAAALAAVHFNTPALTILDSLGRDVIAIARNRVKDPNGSLVFGGEKYRDDYYLTYSKLDAEGKPLWIRDARGNLVMQYITPAKANNDPSDDMLVNSVPCYDIAGNLLFQHSMDAGDRWMLMDAAGKPMLAWDVNETPQGNLTTHLDRTYSTDYDNLHRPTAQWLAINGAARIMVERYEYQDAQLNDANNLNGQLVRHYDPSGCIETNRRDFKGNVQEVHRTLNNSPQQSVIDWQTSPESQLETDANGNPVTYTQITEYDALNRMTRLYNWHRLSENRIAIYEPQYNERGALLSEDLVMRATGYDSTTGTRTNAIKEIRYNAKGQKTYLKLGNDTVTRYEYDPNTFRLVQLRTTRPNQDPAFPGTHANLANLNVLQQLNYTYDPVGNIAEIYDEAYKPVFFDNGIVEPKSLYEYDALYRLISATGRETAQGGDAALNGDEPAIGSGFPITDQTLRRYNQNYEYDEVGNFVTMQHSVPTDTASGWTRHYECFLDSNRLHYTWNGSSRTAQTEYLYDTHGNMLNLANVAPGQYLQWDHRDMISSIDLVGGGLAYYQYDAGKQRTRKLIQRRITDANGNEQWINDWERIYLGGFELYRRRNSVGQVVEEIESHHLFEGEQRVLLVDDVIVTNKTHADGRVYQTGSIYRYQYSNHLGSACLELDHQADIISYEEYHPYGTSAYRAMKSDTEAPPKRYRYTGMERDEESRLGYHSARYYLPWLGRWMSCDPSGLKGSKCFYAYCSDNPVVNCDMNGMQDEQAVRASIEELEKQKKWLESLSAYGKKHSRYQVTFVIPEDMQPSQSLEASLDDQIAELKNYEEELRQSKSSDDPGFMAKAVGNWFVDNTIGLALIIVQPQLLGSEENMKQYNLIMSMFRDDDFKTKHDRESARGIGYALDVAMIFLPFAEAKLAKGPTLALKGASALPLLSDAQVVANAEALFVATATTYLESRGVKVTADAIRSLRRMTVAVLQGTKDGKVVTLVAVNDARYFRDLQRVGTASGFEVIMNDAIVPIGKRGYPMSKFEWPHAERALIEEGTRRGLESMRMASSNPGCFGCVVDAAANNVLHLNPVPLD